MAHKDRKYLFKIFFGLFIGMSGVVLSQDLLKKEEDRLKLIGADSLVNISYQDMELIELWGHVQLRQGDAYLFCDFAKFWQVENRAILYGDVLIYDNKRKLKGDQVDYDGQDKIETASGHVSIISGSRILNANEVTYWQEQEQTTATGDVIIQDILENVTLKSQKVFHDKQLDYSLAREYPVLSKIDTVAKDTLEIYGLKMEIWGEEERALVTDSVSIQKGDLIANCQRAEYQSESELLILLDTPEIMHRNQIMYGDTIDILLKEVHFQGAVIRGHALIVSTDSTFQDKLEGQKITVEAIDDTIRKVIVENQAKSYYHIFNEEDEFQGVNSVTGDHIILDFDKDDLKEITVMSDPGQCTGVYSPEKPENN